MNLNRILSAITRTERNKINQNFETLERTYKNVVDTSSDAKQVANGANVKSDNAVQTADEAKDKSEYVQQQLDNIVADGDSSAEVVQARGDFVNLRERLDDEKTQFTEQLAQTDEKTPWQIVSDFTSIALQQRINAASDGETIVLKPGRYLVTSQMSWSNKELHLLAFGNVTFVEQNKLNAPLIHATNCGKSTFTNLNCEGAEDLATFAGATEKDYCFIKLTNATKAKISNSNVTDKSYGVVLENCRRCKVIDINMDGFLTTGSLAENGANYSSVVRILGGKGNIVKEFSAVNVGSGVSTGLEGEAHVISDGYVENARDNGIYVSSGKSIVVEKIYVASSLSSGVKVRGSKHKVQSCEVKNTLVGYSLTGNGIVTDEYGFNGHANACVNNIAENCNSIGISVGDQDGLYGRDFTILNNTLINCGGTASNLAAIRILRGMGHQVKGNTVDGTNSDFAILVSSAAGQDCENLDISDNYIRNAKYGVRTLYVKRSKINANQFKSLSNTAIDCRYTVDSEINNNDYAEGLVVSVGSTYANSGNKVQNNRGLNIGVSSSNYFSGNLPYARNYEDSISNVPYHVGQRALVGGVLYEAVGTSSISHWQRISNVS